MKKVINIIVLISVILVNSSFATPLGFLWTDVKEPVAASSLKSYTKTASGTNMSILGLIGIGDSSIEKVAKEAGIKTIKHIDKHTMVFPFYIFATETFTIYGD